ncbi:isochorismate synthase [Pontibacter sp. CAU 1760]
MQTLEESLTPISPTTEIQEISLEQLFRAAVSQHCAIAVWRLPNSDAVEACLSFHPEKKLQQPVLEDSPFGFMFSPFEVQAQHPIFFIEADIYYSSATGKLTPAASVREAKLNAFLSCPQKPQTAQPHWHVSAPATQHSFQQEECFKKAVTEAVEVIRDGEMEKVVMSRNSLEHLQAGFNPVEAFSTMEQEYPRAFVSLVSIPGAGTWMGASPEILVSVNTNQEFHTVALAGTQPADDTTSVANAIWRQKEIEEQAMVERYILNCFKTLRLRDYTEIGPRTVVAGNLMHLRTDFRVDLKEVDFPTLATDMLQLLHPTSAVCGLPKAPALHFIKAKERYNRSYYSGYLGPVNSPSGTHLHVNLRCMELLKNQAILYAGAGITAESNPDKEWQETQHKMQTMRLLLNLHEK